jgi:DNA (cytosine-5)-methyltransferase 1
MLTFGSLFAGIGGLDLGLERAGMRCAWQVEIDDYATRVLANHWPDVPRFRDVRSVGVHNLPAVDLICGGFPCQDISSAGKRAGITGTRSGLWGEFARLIRELRPRYVLVENVAALLYVVRRGKRIIEQAPIGCVLGELAALGYDAEWHCIPAAAVGAPHIRDRVFILAYAQCDRRQQGTEILWPGQSIATAGGEDVPNAPSTRSGELAAGHQQGQWKEETDSYGCGETLADSDRAWDGGTAHGIRTRRNVIIRRRPSGYTWCAEPAIRRVAHGVPHRVDRLRGLGNAVVPQVAEFVGRLILDHESSFASCARATSRAI